MTGFGRRLSSANWFSPRRYKVLTVFGLPAVLFLLACPLEKKKSQSQSTSPSAPSAEVKRAWPSEASATAQDGGTAVLTVQTEGLDVATLAIPAGGVPAATNLTLRSVANPSTAINPARVLDTFEIDAKGMTPAKPGLFSVTRATGRALSPTARLYFLNPDGRLTILPRPELSGQILTARLYHSSKLVVADPTLDELRSGVTDPTAEPPQANASDLDIIQWAETASTTAAQAQLLGGTDLAESIQTQVRNNLDPRLEQGVSNLEPGVCDGRTTTLGRLLEIAQTIGAPNAIEEALVRAITEASARCIRNARLEYSAEISLPTTPRLVCSPIPSPIAAESGVASCSLSLGAPVPLTKFDDGRLRGAGPGKFGIRLQYSTEEFKEDIRSESNWTEGVTGEVLLATLKFQRQSRDLVENVTGEGTGEGRTLRPIEYHYTEDSDGKGTWNLRVGYPEYPPTFITAKGESLTRCGGGTEDAEWAWQPIFKGHYEGDSFGKGFDCINPLWGFAFPVELQFPIEDGATFVSTALTGGGVFTWTATLHFEVDNCDQDAMKRVCERQAQELIRVCKTLNDWEVVAQIGVGAEPQVTCASSDCSGTIKRNEGRPRTPFTSIVKTLDNACDDRAPVICNLECYGWPK